MFTELNLVSQILNLIYPIYRFVYSVSHTDIYLLTIEWKCIKTCFVVHTLIFFYILIEYVTIRKNQQVQTIELLFNFNTNESSFCSDHFKSYNPNFENVFLKINLKYVFFFIILFTAGIIGVLVYTKRNYTNRF